MTKDATLPALRDADKPPSLPAVVADMIARQTAAMKLALPAGHDADRFARLVLTAVKANPKLTECFRTDQGQVSVLLSVMQLAAVGLEPNTATQDAWLLPRANKGVMECQVSYGYRGLLKLARRAGDMKSISAAVVREGEAFRYSRGIEDDLHHVPGDGTGEITHAYAIVRYTNGGHDFVVLNRRDLDKRRAVSESWQRDQKNATKYSPWTVWHEEMCCKTALRALTKIMRLEADVLRAIETDERTLSLDDDGVIVAELTHDDTPELEAGE